MPKAKSGSKKTKTNKKRADKDISKPISITSTEPRSFASGYRLFRMSVQLLWRNKKLFVGVLTTIGVLQLLLIQGIINSDFASVRGSIEEVFGAGLTSGAVSYVYLLGSSGQPNSTEAGLYQSTLMVVLILALIWCLREIHAGAKVRVRDAFYRGMYPLVPFTLVTLIIGLQLIPAVVGAWIYSVVSTNNIAVHGYEQIFWLAVLITGFALSLRFITGSVFALFISTLPDATPIASVKASQKLTKGLRLIVLRKVAFLGLLLLLMITAVMLPIILIVPAVAPVLFYVLNLVMLAIAVVYMHMLYREFVGRA